MTQHPGFLRDIIDHPEDDAPRLVYADWLDDHGEQPRAELVRAQCELAKGVRGLRRRRELEARQTSLLREHGRVWAEPLLKLVSKWEFRRGFVERVAVAPDKLLAHADAIFATGPVRDLRIEEGKGFADALAAMPHLPRLEALELWAGKLGDEGAQALAAAPGLSNLRKLTLISNDIRTAGARALAGSPHLAGLTYLRFSGNGIGTDGALALLDSPHLARVRSLGLYYALWSIGGVARVVAHPRVAKLAGLDVGCCFEQDFSMGSLGPLLASPNLAKLRSLGISTNGLRDEGARILAKSPILSRLTELDVCENRIENDGVKALAASKHLASLKLTRLDLGTNGFGDAGAKALASSPYLCRLTELDLAVNAIRDEGAKALAASTTLRKLADLNLWGNSIKDEGALALAASRSLAGLRKLTLDEDDISPACRDTLRQMPGGRVHIPVTQRIPV